MIYMDNAATTRMSESVINTVTRYMNEVYGNPSSLHSVGQIAAEALFEARHTIADCLGCKAREIYFTSGGSEADNQAIFSGFPQKSLPIFAHSCGSFSRIVIRIPMAGE